jgi:hypothetical protein
MAYCSLSLCSLPLDCVEAFLARWWRAGDALETSGWWVVAPIPTFRGDRGRAELAPGPCACVRLVSTPSGMALVWRWDACWGLAGSLPGVVIPLSAVVFERGGGGLVEPSGYGGAETGEVGAAELGCELEYGFEGAS